jgi:UDP-N-acetylmuramyl tripeptide synthase
MQVVPESEVAPGLIADLRADHARLCQALAGDPSRRLKLIGVAGQSGKTTTSCLIAGVLTAAGYRTGVMGPLGYLDGRGIEPATHATPPPERLASLLARMADNECSHAVMTISGRALAQSQVAGVSFDAMCVTTCRGLGVGGGRREPGLGTRPQTGRHSERSEESGANSDPGQILRCDPNDVARRSDGSREVVGGQDLSLDRDPDPCPSGTGKKGTVPICAKHPSGRSGKWGLSPFSGLSDQGFAVINADDRGAASWLRRLDRPVLTVGIETAAEITAVPIEQCPSEQTFLLTAGSETVPVRTQMIGRRHVSNCLVAAAVGLAYNIELSTVARGLESVGHVPGRLERIECGQPFSTFVDGARTPGALAGVLNALRPVVAGRLICVLSADCRTDGARRARLGRIAEQRADQLVLTSGNARREDAGEVFGDLLRGVHCPGAATVIADRMTAIHWALGVARPGDCVLIAGKRHDACQPLGRRLADDDREVARAWLRQHR